MSNVLMIVISKRYLVENAVVVRAGRNNPNKQRKNKNSPSTHLLNIFYSYEQLLGDELSGTHVLSLMWAVNFVCVYPELTFKVSHLWIKLSRVRIPVCERGQRVVESRDFIFTINLSGASINPCAQHIETFLSIHNISVVLVDIHIFICFNKKFIEFCMQRVGR